MKRILIVEPSKNLGKLLKEMFVGKSYDVDLATDAQNAIHLADKKSPDLVILEIALPGHNGVEFLHEFRSYKEWMDTPIIIYSQIESTGKDSFRSFGIAKYFYKPSTTLKELAQAAAETL